MVLGDLEKSAAFPEGFRTNGWRFESSSGPILNTRELEALKARLKGVYGADMPALPDAIFGHNRLTLTHEASGRVFHFDAEGAIACWMRASAQKGSGGLQVTAAARPSWKAAAADETLIARKDDYDWTFSCDDYCGITRVASGGAGAEADSRCGVPARHPSFIESSFSTKVEYEAWLCAQTGQVGATDAGAAKATPDSPWTAHKGSGLDMAMLRRRDLPIEHYVDIPLYEDELDDNGESMVRLRLRVMPTCFLILLRHALRVDGMFIRQCETRIFHKFGTPYVLRERRLAKATLQPMRAVPDPADDQADAAPAADAPRAVYGSASHPNEQQAAEMLAMLPSKSESIEELILSLPLSDAPDKDPPCSHATAHTTTHHGAAPPPSDGCASGIRRASLGTAPPCNLPDHGSHAQVHHLKAGMSKRITSQAALAAFKSSPSYEQLHTFIKVLAESVTGMALTEEVQVSKPLQALLEALQRFSNWVDDIPSIQQTMRYGNKAFVQWHGRINEASLPLARRLLDSGGSGATDAQVSAEVACVELAVYLSESFGNATRIDYGTGHELSFVAFLCAAERAGVFSAADRPALVLRAFQQYLALVRKLQTTYWLEPAGSHGVWGLDDYQHLPFFFGAAQLSLQRELAPACVHDEVVLEAEHGRWMYLAAIRFIRQIKTGCLFENSPKLDDLSVADSWSHIRDKLLSMYLAEVLGKLPVVQHFPFGRLLPWSNAPDDPPSHAGAEPPPPTDKRLAVLAKIKADKEVAAAAKAEADAAAAAKADADADAAPEADAVRKTQVRHLRHPPMGPGHCDTSTAPLQHLRT